MAQTDVLNSSYSHQHHIIKEPCAEHVGARIAILQIPMRILQN